MAETQQTIATWATETFGPPTSPLRVAARANEEMAELLRQVSMPTPDWTKVAEEAADVLIVLCRLGILLDTPKPLNIAWPNLVDVDPRVPVAQIALVANLDMAGLLHALEFDDADQQSHLLDAVWSGVRTVIKASGLDPRAVVNAKMAVNRARTWRKDATGHGYHVRAGSEAEARTQVSPSSTGADHG